MTRITAKKLLVGKVFYTFLSMAFSVLISLFGISLVALSVFAMRSEKIKAAFSDSFGEYSFALITAAGVLVAFTGLFLFALGNNLKTKTVCKTVSDDGFVCSVKKSFEFLLYFCIKILFTLCWGFIYLLPCAVCTAFLVMSLSQGAMEKNVFYSWVTGSIVLFLLGLFFTFVTVQRYCLWTYYLCREDGGVISSLYKSIDKTNDRCVRIAFFKLSMSGWILSCLLVLPIVYVLPYYGVSSVLFSLDELKKRQEKKREEIPPAVFRVIRNR